MTNKTEFKAESTKIFFMTGSFSDLSLIDFSFINIKCELLDVKNLESFYESYSSSEWIEHNVQFTRDVIKNYWDPERIWVFSPISFIEKCKEEDFNKIYEVLLLLFPSDLAITWICDCQLFEGKFIYMQSCEEWDSKSISNTGLYDKFLYFDKDKLDEINEFIRLYFDRIEQIKYLRTSKNAYISSYYERNPTMAYLSLCISLESMVNGTAELNYRIRRNTAMLIAISKSMAECIYDNLKEIYNLRSKIVHGSEYKLEKVAEYLPYLRSVVSRSIIEIVLLNLPNVDDLNRKLTFAGFEDRRSFSIDYKEMTLNTNSLIDTYYEILKNNKP